MTKITNWSKTKTITVNGPIYSPRTLEEFHKILLDANKQRSQVLIINSSTAPSGIGVPHPSFEGMIISTANINFVEYDQEAESVYVGAGITFENVDNFLKKFNLRMAFNYPTLKQLPVLCVATVGAQGAGGE